VFLGKDPACRSEQRAVPAPVDRALDLPAQDPELVAKDEDLNLCGIVGAMVRCHKAEEPTKHQVEERSKHGGDTVMRGRCSTSDHVGGLPDRVLVPHGAQSWFSKWRQSDEPNAGSTHILKNGNERVYSD
jgi:hypothetical protein